MSPQAKLMMKSTVKYILTLINVFKNGLTDRVPKVTFALGQNRSKNCLNVMILTTAVVHKSVRRSYIWTRMTPVLWSPALPALTNAPRFSACVVSAFSELIWQTVRKLSHAQIPRHAPILPTDWAHCMFECFGTFGTKCISVKKRKKSFGYEHVLQFWLYCQ